MFFENREEESNERLRRKSCNVSRLRRDGVSHLYQVIKSYRSLVCVSLEATWGDMVKRISAHGGCLGGQRR